MIYIRTETNDYFHCVLSVQKSEKTRHGDILKLQQSENQIYTV